MSNFILVTGVSSGIGLGIARDLIGQGYTVFGSVRKQADGQRVAQELGAGFIPLHFDVTDAEAIHDAAKEVRSLVGNLGLAGLVNNAGINLTGPLLQLELGDIRALFEVNVFGVIAVTRAFLPLLMADPATGRKPGRIVNISSVSGAFAAPFLGAYAGAKHAVEAVTQALRRELTIYGIHVCAIEPSFVKTDMLDKGAHESEAERFDGTDYASQWRAFLGSLLKSGAKAPGVEVVAAAVRHALFSRKPKTRYPLDSVWWFGRFLPDRQFDRLIFKAIGFGRVGKHDTSSPSLRGGANAQANDRIVL